MGAQGVFRHQLQGNLPRKLLINTTLDVDFGKFIKLKLAILAQLPAFASQIRLFGVELLADGHIFTSGHRHGASHQSCDAGDQDSVLRRGRNGNPNDQARGRNNSIIGPEHGGSQPPDAVDEVVLGERAKTVHVFLLITPSSFIAPATVFETFAMTCAPQPPRIMRRKRAPMARNQIQGAIASSSNFRIRESRCSGLHAPRAHSSVPVENRLLDLNLEGGFAEIE
jgi:hypothetical protein